MAALKYTECAGSFFPLFPALVSSEDFTKFRVDSSSREIRSNAVLLRRRLRRRRRRRRRRRCNFLIFNLVIKRGIKTLLK